MAETKSSGTTAPLSIPLNQEILCVMSDMREDLRLHFIDVDGMGYRAATRRADAALRIDPREWRQAMRWLREDTRWRRQVKDLARELLSTPLTFEQRALMDQAAQSVEELGAWTMKTQLPVSRIFAYPPSRCAGD